MQSIRGVFTVGPHKETRNAPDRANGSIPKLIGSFSGFGRVNPGAEFSRLCVGSIAPVVLQFR